MIQHSVMGFTTAMEVIQRILGCCLVDINEIVLRLPFASSSAP